MGKIYGDQYSYNAVGFVDDQGKVRADEYGPVIGRVEASGNDAVVHGSEWGHDPRGRIDSSGTVYRGEFGYDQVGRVQEDGQIFDTGFSVVGRAEAPHIQWSGAAYLLLIR